MYDVNKYDVNNDKVNQKDGREEVAYIDDGSVNKLE